MTLSSSKTSKILDSNLGYVLVFLVAFSVTFLIFTGYRGVLALTNKLEYIIVPEKQAAEYEKFTAELISIYGSGPAKQAEQIEYSQNVSGSLANAYYPNNNIASNHDTTTGNNIYIPGVNINAPIVMGASTDAKTILSQLKEGVLVYPGSDIPGNGGSTVIIGHSSSDFPWQKYAHVFAALPDLSRGDMIIINYNGNKYAYNVNEKITGSVDELATRDIKGDLILGTCWPIGTDEQRILVTASLVSTTNN